MNPSDRIGLPVRPWAVIAYLCGDNPKLAGHVRSQRDAILQFKGSDHFHVAVQWDLPAEGGGRAVLSAAEGWQTEKLGPVNTGDPGTFLTFLRWAFDCCPADKVIVVVSGTGLLDERASFGGPDTDRAHLFTICDDATAVDALSLSEVGPMFRKAVDLACRDRIDILALDLRELQCLEVAYELEGTVDILIAPQTRVPDAGWNFDAVLSDLETTLSRADPANPPDSAQLAKRLVDTVGAAYEKHRNGHLSLSALNLHALKNFASAFDTLSLAMMHSVGEELVWQARVAVANKLKPGDPSAVEKGSPLPERPSTIESSPEVEYLYDLFELLHELKAQMEQWAKTGLFRMVTEHLQTLDVSGFKRALESIETACFMPQSARRVPPASIADPLVARDRLRALLENSAARIATWEGDDEWRAMELSSLFTSDSTTKTSDYHSWLDDWPEETIAELTPGLRATYIVAKRQLPKLTHLAKLAGRVLTLLQTGASGQDQIPVEPLVLACFVSTSEDPSRHGGVSLYRPRNLDQLVESDYLKLRFNQKIHWTVLLAVINLIGSHPRALWRILSALLATADNSTRAQIIDRIAGPDSVVAPFRDQFVVLSPVKAYVLSLEPDPGGNDSRPDGTNETSRPSRPHAYRVRLELADREAFISEFRSIVDPDALDTVIDGLKQLLQPGTPLTEEDAKRIESLGETLGEDILQELGIRLTQARHSSQQIHLQLQIPRELMKYPWELMHYKDGWLSEHFAMGRQVFSRLGGGVMRSRVPGPLRALVIGNPPTKERTLPYAAHEAVEIANTFAALAAETDGLLDFKRERDAYINKEVTRSQLRELLRHGNYDLIHFAGHAVYDEDNPGASAWLLSDGRLTARSIRNTLRWRDTQPWLVYANACESGMDAGEDTGIYQNDVFGIASAFLDHGVSVFVGPLWRIDDRIAANIAKMFYHQLLKERQAVGEALRIAKADAKAKTFDTLITPTPSQPAGQRTESRVENVSWAGLVLYGNSTANFGQRIGAPPPPER